MFFVCMLLHHMYIYLRTKYVDLAILVNLDKVGRNCHSYILLLFTCTFFIGLENYFKFEDILVVFLQILSGFFHIY